MAQIGRKKHIVETETTKTQKNGEGLNLDKQVSGGASFLVKLLASLFKGNKNEK